MLLSSPCYVIRSIRQLGVLLSNSLVLDRTLWAWLRRSRVRSLWLTLHSGQHLGEILYCRGMPLLCHRLGMLNLHMPGLVGLLSSPELLGEVGDLLVCLNRALLCHVKRGLLLGEYLARVPRGAIRLARLLVDPVAIAAELSDDARKLDAGRLLLVHFAECVLVSML